MSELLTFALDMVDFIEVYDDGREVPGQLMASIVMEAVAFDRAQKRGAKAMVMAHDRDVAANTLVYGLWDCRVPRLEAKMICAPTMVFPDQDSALMAARHL